MTQEKLREKIAGLRHDCFNTCPHWQKDCFQHDWIVHNEGLCPRIQDQILALIAEAGYVKLADIRDLYNDSSTSLDQFRKYLNQAGAK